MTEDLQKLAIRIKRLTLDPSKQEALVKEVQSIKPAQASFLESLLKEHDKECVELLNQKLKERQEVTERITEGMGVNMTPEVQAGPEDFKQFAEEIFASKESFGLFLVYANDEVVAALADVVIKLAPEDSKEHFAEFFTEIRAHKRNVDKRTEEAVRQDLIKRVEEREKHLAELEGALASIKKNMTYIV